MPRKATDAVTEHRITLGDFERQELNAFLETQKRDTDLDLILDVGRALAGPVAIAATGFMIYQGMVGWSTGRDKIAEWWDNLTSPATGPTVGDVPAASAGLIDGFFTLVFGPLGYEGGGTFSDGSSFGDMWRAPDGGGGGGF